MCYYYYYCIIKPFNSRLQYIHSGNGRLICLYTSYYERTSVCLFVCLCVCVFPSPGRIVAPIVVIFGTRVLCRPGKVIGYQKILSLASLAHAAQKKRAAGLSSHSFAPIGVKIATRLLCHPAKILSRASLRSLTPLRKSAPRARAKRAKRVREAHE